jgi:sulfur relay (sulfurtransferase) DsrF/TusC family protein
MKSLLVILIQSPLKGQTVLESLSAVMVLATYGIKVNVFLTGDAISMLRAPIENIRSDSPPRPFKSANALVESFEFYDLLPVWVDQTHVEQNQALLQSTAIEHEIIQLNPQMFSAFDGVLHW